MSEDRFVDLDLYREAADQEWEDRQARGDEV